MKRIYLTLTGLLLLNAPLNCMKKQLTFPNFSDDEEEQSSKVGSPYAYFEDCAEEQAPFDESYLFDNTNENNPFTKDLLEKKKTEEMNEDSTKKLGIEVFAAGESFNGGIPNGDSASPIISGNETSDHLSAIFEAAKSSPIIMHPLQDGQQLGNYLSVIVQSRQENKNREESLKDKKNEELLDQFTILKKSIAGMALLARQDSEEYILLKKVWEELKSRYKDVSTVKKATLGIADYEDDIEQTNFDTEDGSTVYRVTKNYLTYSLPSIQGFLSELQRTISRNMEQKVAFDKQIQQLQEQSDILVSQLQQDRQLRAQYEQAKSIIELERINYEKYLIVKKESLKKEINELVQEIKELENQIEEAILGHFRKQPKYNSSNSKPKTKEELKNLKNEAADKLNKAKSTLSTLENNLSNIDTPSKYFGIW